MKAWTWGPIERALSSSWGAGGLDPGALVGLRLVLLDGGGAAPGVAADMAGDVPAPEEDVDQVAAQADIDLLADMLVGHRVEVVIYGDVVIAVDRVLAPHRVLPPPLRQRLHVGEIDALEAAVAVLAGTVGIGPSVDLPDLGGDRPVQRRQVMD